jgi:hypothetical protein
MDDGLKTQIFGIMDAHRIMTVATLRSDGWPQATTVGFAHEDLALYFLCGAESQKAKNLAEAERVMGLLIARYPQQSQSPGELPPASAVAIFKVTPIVISLLDYAKGFGHAELVIC